MAHIAKGSLLVRVGAALSSLVLLGVSGLAYLFVTDAYDTYPVFSSHSRSLSSSVLSQCATRYHHTG